MLVQLDNSLASIERDAKDQTTEMIESNMAALRVHVKGILKLDGISALTSKGRE